MRAGSCARVRHAGRKSTALGRDTDCRARRETLKSREGLCAGGCGDPTAPLLYFGTTASTQLWRSTDGGATWAQFSTGLPASAVVHAIAARGAHVYAGTSQGIFRYDGANSTWTLSGLATLDVVAVAIDPITPAIVYCAASAPGALYITTTGG